MCGRWRTGSAGEGEVEKEDDREWVDEGVDDGKGEGGESGRKVGWGVCVWRRGRGGRGRWRRRLRRWGVVQ